MDHHGINIPKAEEDLRSCRWRSRARIPASPPPSEPPPINMELPLELRHDHEGGYLELQGLPKH
jgi:hypothetical protein